MLAAGSAGRGLGIRVLGPVVPPPMQNHYQDHQDSAMCAQESDGSEVDPMGLTVDQAYVLVLMEELHQAWLVARLDLTLDERVSLLPIWLHSVVAWVAKAYFLTTLVMLEAWLVHRVAPASKNWGMTITRLSQHQISGGADFV